MFVSRSIGLYILLNFIVLCQGEQLSLKLAYPEDEEENPYGPKSQGKSPVHIPQLCKSGEIFYPGDQLDDWLCDCKPTYLYHPATDQCYPAYKQGPCESGECLILPENSGVPKCRPNPCAKDNFVQFRDECHELDKPGPCSLPELWNVVGVNETTLNIICTKDERISLGLGTRLEGHGNGSSSDSDSKISNGNNHGIAGSVDDIINQIFDTANTAQPQSAGVESPPPRQPDSSTPNLNGGKILEKRCYIGGRRWTNKQCPGQT